MQIGSNGLWLDGKSKTLFQWKIRKTISMENQGNSFSGKSGKLFQWKIRKTIPVEDDSSTV